MGSTVSLAVGLVMTWIVILFLPADEARFAPEQPALIRAVVVFTLFAALTAGSFYGELRERPGGSGRMPPRSRCSPWRCGSTGRGEALPRPVPPARSGQGAVQRA